MEVLFQIFAWFRQFTDPLGIVYLTLLGSGTSLASAIFLVRYLVTFLYQMFNEWRYKDVRPSRRPIKIKIHLDIEF